MNVSWVPVVIALIALIPVQTSVAAESCLKIHLGNIFEGGASDFFEIKQSGRYCLMADVVARGEPFAWVDGGERSSNGFIGYVLTSGASIDLMGRVLDARNLGGSGLTTGGVRGGVKKLSIRNGKIISKTGGGIMSLESVRWDIATPKDDFFFPSSKVPALRAADESIYMEYVNLVDKLRDDFPGTEHEVESMDIASKREAVTIRGAGNVIKNSRLRATGVSVALDLSGPNQLIEGNTIVISSGSKDSAPIVLKMADNSVIRNNTIIIEGFGDKPEAAIHLIDSKNVVIENNKIVGVKKLYMTSKTLPNQISSVIEGKGERSNEFVSGWRRLFVH